MEQEPGQDPETDGPSDPEPGSGSPNPGPDDAGSPAEPDELDGLEDTAEAAAARAALVSGFARGGEWDGRPPGPELAAALTRAAGPQWRCGLAAG